MSAPAPPQRPRGRGRPPCCSRELATTIIELRRQGMTYGQICIALNARGMPTPMGRPMWMKSYVVRLLRTRHVQDLIEELAPTDERTCTWVNH
jgi:hypothetical protein